MLRHPRLLDLAVWTQQEAYTFIANNSTTSHTFPRDSKQLTTKTHTHAHTHTPQTAEHRRGGPQTGGALVTTNQL